MKKRIAALLLSLTMLVTSASALTVEQARELLSEHYIDEIPEDVLAHDTIEEILFALGDRYTEYYTAKELAGFYSSIEDVQMVGIGIRSYFRTQGVEIDQVAPGGPAAQAGLQAGDWIVAVDGKDIRGAAEEDVYSRLRGEEGTSVGVTVLRGEETFDVVLTRRQVVFPTAMLEKIEDGIGWISCSSFGSNTFAQFYEILTAYDAQVNGWVVDLRGNSGGNAITATLAAGCFGGWNSGIYMRTGKDQYYAYLSKANLMSAMEPDLDLSVFDENGYLTGNTVCVLTDESTASAAELFCAVIRDSGAGVIVGARTYGKGIAQTLFSQDYYLPGMEDYFSEGDAIKITSERCFSVMGSTYDQVGILPHVLVDGDLADEAAELLMAPYTDGDDALILRDVCRTSRQVQHFVMPLELVRTPEYSEVVAQLLSTLPPQVTCQIRQDGGLRLLSAEEAALICGVAWDSGTFSDLADSPYAQAVEVMRIYGIVDGYGDGTFLPREGLTRAEMCALLVKALRCPMHIDANYMFSDVPAANWYAPYVNTMCRLGLVKGDGNGAFRPEEPITNQEFLVLLGRVAQWLDMSCYELMKHDSVLYGDVLPYEDELAQQYGNFADWARESIWLCDGEYAWTDVGQIDPSAATTREQAAEAVYRLFCRSGLFAD